MNELAFESKDLLWVYALVALAAGGVLLFFHWKGRVLARIGDVPLVRRMTAQVSTAAQWVKWVMVLVAAALVATGLLRPQYGVREAEIANRGIDVVFVLDLSKSMLVQDVAPNRLKAAIVELESLMGAMSGGRVALVPFAGVAYTQTPLTTDFDAVRSYLEDLRVEDMPVGGTRIGRALRHAISVFEPEPSDDAPEADEDPDLAELEQPKASHYKAIVLVTDGEDHDADAVEAAKLAKDKNIHVFTVGIGSQSSAARIPVVSSEGERLGWVYDEAGKPIFSELNVGLLKDVADASGGAMALYGRDDVAGTLSKALDSLEKKEYEHYYENLGEDRFQFVLVPALALLVLETLITDRRRRRGWRR